MAIAIAAWLSCGTLNFAEDVALPPASTPPTPALASPAESANLVVVWKQLVAAREEAAQLRQEADENARALATVRDLERQLAETRAALAQRIQLFETAETERNRLQQQAVSLQERGVSIAALETNLQQTQAEVRRLAQSLVDAQAANEVLVRAKNLMLERQVQNHLDQDAAQQAVEDKARSLGQEKVTLAKALAVAEAKSRQELAAAQAGLAAKEKSLTDAKSQIQQFKAEAGKSAARIVEIEQQQSQEQAQADATAKDLQKSLKAEQARTVALEKEKNEFSAKTLELEKARTDEKARAETAEQGKAVQAKTAAEMDKQRQQLQAEAEKAAARLAEAGKQLEQEKNRSAALEKEKSEVSAKVRELENSLKKDPAKKSDQVSALEKQLVQEQKRSAEAEQALASAKARAETAAQEKADQAKALAEAREQAQQLEKETKQLSARIAQSETRPAREESPDLALAEENAKQAKAARESEAKCQEELASLRETLKANKKALDDASEKIRRLWADAAEAEKQLPLRREAAGALQAAEARAKMLETEQAKTAQQTKQMEKELAATLLRMQKLEEQVESQTNRAGTLEKERTAQAETLRKLQQELDKALAQIRKDGR